SGPGQGKMALPWPFGAEITKSKHQITKKPLITIINDPNLPGRDIVWIFEFWAWVLFGICNLIFVISIIQ
ncbi:MAG: hypothetical protein Q8P24_13980, partial [Desulfobacterales bacterium]|nr:hypothetical protein [Desulfobacterales bacterium]